jgi:hypothetical protein
VVLVRGSAPARLAPGDTLVSGQPEIRIGYVNLPVLPGGRRLAVRVEPPASAGPGDSVAVRVAVTREADGTAADAEVTLMLVDEAVLRLLGTPTPDPFARRRGLGGERGQGAAVEVWEEARATHAWRGRRRGRLPAALRPTAFAPDLRTGRTGWLGPSAS